MELDTLDAALIEILAEHLRAGVLEVSRLAGVARATVAARLERLGSSGVITGYGPQLDLVAAGYPVQAFVTLEIAQGRLEEVRSHLESIPGVLEACAITGAGDVVCRLAAPSNEGLQALLLELDSSPAIRRSTSAIVLSVVVAPRFRPLLAASRPRAARRAPAYRSQRPENGSPPPSRLPPIAAR
jgi:DNA-binding Lrp family transcriptional regulator